MNHLASEVPMKRSPGTRKTSASLPEPIRRQLNMYALAASAAGVGVLALSQASEAKIVYTKTHQVIKLGQHYDLDLNHDGIADFTLSNSYYPPEFFVYVLPRRAGGIVGQTYFHRAYAFLAGVTIGPGWPFHGGKMAVSDPNGVSDWYGYWVNARNRYLGLKLEIKGKNYYKPHYGWARLDVKLMPYHGFTATLTGYAYETIPNKPIITGKTKGQDVLTMPDSAATLGHLALGRK